MSFRERVPTVAIPFVVSYPQGIPSILMANTLQDGLVTTPGGEVKLGERPRQAAKREIWKETGLVVSLPEILTVAGPVSDITAGGLQILAHTFLVYYKPTHGIPETKEPTKHSRWEWAPIAEVDWQLAHHWLFPFRVFFNGDWLYRVEKHGQRLRLTSKTDHPLPSR